MHLATYKPIRCMVGLAEALLHASVQRIYTSETNATRIQKDVFMTVGADWYHHFIAPTMWFEEK